MLLKVQDLEIKYGENVSAVQNVSFELKSGEVLAIVGESGSGKTSVIRAIQNCLPVEGAISGGDIHYKGTSLIKRTKRERRSLCGAEISMIFQDNGSMLNPVKTIGKQFSEYLQVHGYKKKNEAMEKARQMIRRVRLANPENILNSYAFELSGGMKQRVGIAMALSLNPGLLLADEPTSALDATTQAQIILELVEMKKEGKVAMIIVTHHLGIASYLADQILIMKDGKTMEQGRSKEVVSNPQNEYTRMLLDAVPRLGGNYID